MLLGRSPQEKLTSDWFCRRSCVPVSGYHVCATSRWTDLAFCVQITSIQQRVPNVRLTCRSSDTASIWFHSYLYRQEYLSSLLRNIEVCIQYKWFNFLLNTTPSKKVYVIFFFCLIHTTFQTISTLKQKGHRRKFTNIFISSKSLREAGRIY